MPPTSPDVRRQQAPPLAEFAQGAMARAQAQNPKGASLDYAKQQLAVIAEALMNVMKVLSVEKPQLMPVATRMAGMGKVLETQLAQETQGQGTGVAGSEQAKSQMNSSEGPGSLGM